MIWPAAETLPVVTAQGGARWRSVGVPLWRNREGRWLDGASPLGRLTHGWTLPATGQATACHPLAMPNDHNAGRAVYRERIHPPWWVWLLGALWALTLGVAYGAAAGPGIGLLVGLVAFGLAALGLSRAGLRIDVDDQQLGVGIAQIPIELIGDAVALDQEAARRRRGPDADSRAFVALRGWVRTAVAVDVRDDRDPTPYWFISTRHPQKLAAALAAVRSAEA